MYSQLVGVATNSTCVTHEVLAGVVSKQLVIYRSMRCDMMIDDQTISFLTLYTRNLPNLVDFPLPVAQEPSNQF